MSRDATVVRLVRELRAAGMSHVVDRLRDGRTTFAEAQSELQRKTLPGMFAELAIRQERNLQFGGER